MPLFGNDHLLWMLESFLEESGENGEKTAEADKPGPGGDAAEGPAALIAESRLSTVEGVLAEDLPSLESSVLAKDDFYKTLF